MQAIWLNICGMLGKGEEMEHGVIFGFSFFQPIAQHASLLLEITHVVVRLDSFNFMQRQSPTARGESVQLVVYVVKMT